MCKIRHPICSTSFVHSGIKSFSKRRMITIGGWQGVPSHRFGEYTSLFMKVPMLPQHDSPPPPVIGRAFWTTQPRIHGATSLAIFMSLPPQPLLALSCTIMIRHSLLPLPVPMCLLRLYLPHLTSSKASQIYCLTTSIPVPLIKRPPKTSPFLSPPQMQRPAGAFIASGIIIPRPTSANSTSAPVAVALQRNPDLLAHSDLPNHLYSASHPILDNTDSTGLPLSYHSSTAIVPVTPSAMTGSASAPDLGAVAKDDGSPTPGARKDRDIHSEPPSAIRAIHANAMLTLDLPPPSPSLPSVTDMDPAIAGPSLREPNAELRGDPPLDPLHSLYDIV
ncbi:hypothetical protein EDB92DRAFT_2105433 [Lactarius akahatsu]|uniref:Uncharacterized protein n=1 Tax=Lactarius akahatsu TaxID=416441 RepID=A0AAD4LC11_9AGAM|nr:hypothetical protein EDB92DRAFT_2105433 [Lactarius akahatsu]